MAGNGAVAAITPERRRAALEEFKKFKGAGAGSGATDALEAQRQLGALYEVIDESEIVESAD